MNADEYHQQQLEEQRRLEEDPEFREAFEKVFGKMYTKDKIKNVRAQVVLEQNFKRYKEKFNGPT